MLEKLRRTYGDLLLSVGEGGIAASGALGDFHVRILPSGPFVKVASFKLFFFILRMYLLKPSSGVQRVSTELDALRKCRFPCSTLLV